MLDKNYTQKNRLILIGGAPTVGKSTLAKKLSSELNIPWISTDEIRDKIRAEKDEKEYPKTFFFTRVTAQEYLPNYTAAKIVDDQNEESREIFDEIEIFIESKLSDESYIIEGVAILPEFVEKMKKKYPSLEYEFIFCDDVERIRKGVFERGLWDDADKYSDDLKEKEVEWVLVFDTWLKNETKKYKMENKSTLHHENRSRGKCGIYKLDKTRNKINKKRGGDCCPRLYLRISFGGLTFFGFLIFLVAE